MKVQKFAALCFLLLCDKFQEANILEDIMLSQHT